MPGYRNRDGRGRKPATNSVRYLTVGKDRRIIRFIFSEDMVTRLSYYSEHRLANRNYLRMRMRFERFPWDAPQALLIQLTELPEEGTFKLTKDKNSPRWRAEIHADHFEVRWGAPGHKFEDIYFDPDRRGMLVQFPVEALTDAAQERWGRIARHRLMKEGATA